MKIFRDDKKIDKCIEDNMKARRRLDKALAFGKSKTTKLESKETKDDK